MALSGMRPLAAAIQFNVLSCADTSTADAIAAANPISSRILRFPSPDTSMYVLTNNRFRPNAGRHDFVPESADPTPRSGWPGGAGMGICFGGLGISSGALPADRTEMIRFS